MKMVSYIYLGWLFFFTATPIISLNQLSFSGGGSYGAVEIGILKKVMEQNAHMKFDLYTGISAGALNAGILSYYSNIHRGIEKTEQLYSSINNKMIYGFFPPNGMSFLHTRPLHGTLTQIIDSIPEPPRIHTLIGATNMYSGKLDIFDFEKQNDADKVLLLMSSCAIPGIFPPVLFKNNLYADGGTLSNELIQVEHDTNYLNITFITPYEDQIYNDKDIKNLKDVLWRTCAIVMNNFNNPMSSLNENCRTSIGEINKYYVPSEVLKGYPILNFNRGNELIHIGYNHVMHKKYYIC